MPERIIRPGILTSDRVARLSWAEEVFYRRLMSVVDDFGRYDGRCSILRAALYPLQIDKVTNADVEKWRLATAEAGLVSVYAVEGKEYVQVENFGQRLRAEKSRWPDPPGSAVKCPQLAGIGLPDTADDGLDGVVVGDVVDSRSRVRKSRARKAARTPIPPAFAVSDRVKKWATERGFERLDEHFESFVGKCRARSYEYADWDEALMVAVRDDWAGLRAGRPLKLNGNHAPAESFEQRRSRELREQGERLAAKFED